MNKLFDEPLEVFNEKMLRPELQDMDAFVDGIKNIVEAQQKVALQYFNEGSVDAAIPPLKILLHIMAYGNYNGHDLNDPVLRKEFDREYVISSGWYRRRLELKQQKDAEFLKKQINYLNDFIADINNKELVMEMDINNRLNKTKSRLKHIESDAYLEELKGTIGADHLYKAQ